MTATHRLAEQQAWDLYRSYCNARKNIANWCGDPHSRLLGLRWKLAYQERHEARFPFYRRANRMRFLRPA